MPTRHGQTGWIHKDHQTQREFERLSRDVSTIQKDVAAGQPTSPTSSPSTTDWALTVKRNNIVVPAAKLIQSLNFVSPEFPGEADDVAFQITPSSLEANLLAGSNKTTANRQANIKAYSHRFIKKGMITLNKLPDNSSPYEEIDAWKRSGLYITPSRGYYGWYVYNYIDHGWLLEDPNDYMLTLVDTHQYDENGNLLPDIQYKQQFIPEHEGLRIQYRDENNNLKYKDIVILRGIFKPLSGPYMGNAVTYDNIVIDEEARTIETNLVFHYTLEVRK